MKKKGVGINKKCRLSKVGGKEVLPPTPLF